MTYVFNLQCEQLVFSSLFWPLNIFLVAPLPDPVPGTASTSSALNISVACVINEWQK